MIIFYVHAKQKNKEKQHKKHTHKTKNLFRTYMFKRKRTEVYDYEEEKLVILPSPRVYRTNRTTNGIIRENARNDNNKPQTMEAYFVVKDIFNDTLHIYYGMDVLNLEPRSYMVKKCEDNHDNPKKEFNVLFPASIDQDLSNNEVWICRLNNNLGVVERRCEAHDIRMEILGETHQYFAYTIVFQQPENDIPSHLYFDKVFKMRLDTKNSTSLNITN